jgi:hypothetical protein
VAVSMRMAVAAAVCAVLVLARASAEPRAAGIQAGGTRTVFASVVTKEGAPVTDLTAGDFEVREGGKPQAITSATLATTSLRVHVIVSDGGSGAFQLGVLRLAQALAGRAEFALTSVVLQAERILSFTDNPQLFGEAIQKLGRRGTGTGKAQLMDAISGAVKDLAAPGRHPVLIVLRVGNEEASTTPAAPLREAIRTAGATMYVVSRSGASKAAPTFAGVNSMTADAAQRQMDDSELADTAFQLNVLLGDGSRESGGYSLETALTSAVPTMEQLAAEIRNQYAITYAVAAGVKPADKLQVTTTEEHRRTCAAEAVAVKQKV